MTAAIKRFDQQLPHLQMMRHVSQHLDDYAIDHPKSGDNLSLARQNLSAVVSWKSPDWRR
jgi:hypothetical protein